MREDRRGRVKFHKKRGGDRHRPFQVLPQTLQPAFFFANRSQVSTTVSGLSDTDSMP